MFSIDYDVMLLLSLTYTFQKTLIFCPLKYVLIDVYKCRCEDTMDTAKLFINGNSQAVRLPKRYRFEGSEVYVK